MINLQILVGNAGKDAELKRGQSGAAVTRFSVATSNKYQDKTGEWKEQTTWHNVTAFGKLAEGLATRIKKGDLVYVEGRLERRAYTGADGAERVSYETLADKVRVLRHKDPQPYNGNGAGSRPAGSPNVPPPPDARDGWIGAGSATDDDVPF